MKCGLYLGGRREYAIIEGPFDDPREETVPLEVEWTRVFDLSLEVDLEAGSVTFKADRKTVEMELARKIGAITHIGYCALDTVTDFSRIEVSGQ